MDINNDKFRRTSVKAPSILPSYTTMKLRRENERILRSVNQQELITEMIDKAKEEKAEEIAYLLLDIIPDHEISEITEINLNKIIQMRREGGL